MNKMELNKINMTQSSALEKEYKLKHYSRLRKTELINLIDESLRKDKSHTTKNLPVQENTHPKQGEIDESDKSKRQSKRKAQKASKLSKKSKNLRIEIDDLKSQKDNIEDKINERLAAQTLDLNERIFVL